MTIRSAVENEIKLIAQMSRQLFEDEPSDMKLSREQFEDRLQKYMRSGCKAFLFIENTVIGYALVNLARTPYYLVDFFICRDFRRGGKGTAAFNALMQHLHTDCIDLDVFCWNSGGRAFWESLGFKERAIIMRKGNAE